MFLVRFFDCYLSVMLVEAEYESNFGPLLSMHTSLYCRRLVNVCKSTETDGWFVLKASLF